ncbi:hypothetical protein ILUMI_17487 [Ignelater luminosus]|uniref:HAT C-terminal dimerisation domain-containing protein n=1 Tax=Ignelater luminosus TaxID=2038154 RepID=A0A8K0CPB7_IGNLU|nr:hypothetical protein ILUMI_17487 [Ignelater luminosus]
MKKTYDLLQEKYTDKPISFYGCAAHTLNLLVNDITKLNTTDILINSAKAIIKVIKNKSVLTSAFLNLQREKQEPRKCILKLPVATRWASIVLSFESLLKNKNILKALAINDKYQSLIEKRNKTNILDDDIFWKRIESFLKILQPLKKWITVLESDKCRINEVTEAFIEASTHLQGKKSRAYSTFSLARHLSNVDENKVLENLADLRSNSGFWEMQFVQDSDINPNTSSVTFWKGICTEFPLRFVAEEVLTMPATSAATERSFSSYENIHTKKRNRFATADKIKIVTNNDKSLDFFGCKGNDKLSGNATDTSESTVTLGLEEKTMTTNQFEPGFSEEMDAVLYASDELEDKDDVDKDEGIH